MEANSVSANALVTSQVINGESGQNIEQGQNVPNSLDLMMMQQMAQESNDRVSNFAYQAIGSDVQQDATSSAHNDQVQNETYGGIDVTNDQSSLVKLDSISNSSEIRTNVPANGGTSNHMTNLTTLNGLRDLTQLESNDNSSNFVAKNDNMTIDQDHHQPDNREMSIGQHQSGELSNQIGFKEGCASATIASQAVGIQTNAKIIGQTVYTKVDSDKNVVDDDDSVIEIIENNNNKRNNNEVIDLLDDDENNDGKPDDALKRPKLDLSMTSSRVTSDSIMSSANAAAQVSYYNRGQTMPNWMQYQQSTTPNPLIIPPPPTLGIPPYTGASIPGYQQYQQSIPGYNCLTQIYSSTSYRPPPPNVKYGKAEYLHLPTKFVPAWNHLIPPIILKAMRNVGRPGEKEYYLSLLNCSEFTITGTITGLRAAIKEISREHGNATYERDEGEEGRWRIPLGAYRQMLSYLRSDPSCYIDPIPEIQLNVASLGKAQLEKGFPEVKSLIESGVPPQLANALAPFQRGGVDFVLERKGRALLADEMGLGKTIQGIASMSVYQKEWPLLILCPSTARYHWESELLNWLGVDGCAAKNHASEKKSAGSCKNDEYTEDPGSRFKLLRKSQVRVLTSSKDDIIPKNRNIQVVICSYGLAPLLAKNRRLIPGQFRCAIADESHMLKNKATKRTAALLPILNKTNRCVLLSGTPALAKPAELWPQLSILRVEKHGLWDNEEDYMNKYVRKGNPNVHAELHTMLTGSVMIRRLKHDILKSMQPKLREKAIIHVATPEMKDEFHECMKLLRLGKGVLGKLARQHTAIGKRDDDDNARQAKLFGNGSSANFQPDTIHSDPQEAVEDTTNSDPMEALEDEIKRRYAEGRRRIEHTLETQRHELNQEEMNNVIDQMENQLRAELDVYYRERSEELKSQANGIVKISSDTTNNETVSRKTVLNRMYSLTGKAKIPIIVELLKKWLRDPTKGKICIFAHHLYVLDEIENLAGLTNFIRIDGSTNPKSRHDLCTKFQTDPSVKVALLGITAAGVAVTLTASSTVWFAELFWTPAIMVQAEDRCHRIGQQAQVRCMYFVAKGTLDEILWKLLEKKLQDIGEFVEGKEKMKYVINRTFKNEKELHALFKDSIGEGEEDNDFQSRDDEDSNKDLLEFDDDLNDIKLDIQQFGEEEQRMLRPLEMDDDEIDKDEPLTVDSCFGTATYQSGTRDEAIMLSDDDDNDGDDNEVVVEEKRSYAIPQNKKTENDATAEKVSEGFNVAGILPKCRLYRVMLQGPTLGVAVAVFKGRLVISKVLRKQTNDESKPGVGDVLVAIAGEPSKPYRSLNDVLPLLKQALKNPPVELMFAEDAEFATFYAKITRATDAKKARKKKESCPPPKGEVIEIEE